MTEFVPVNSLTAILCAQREWQAMTPRQRDSLRDRIGTRPNTEAALLRRGVVDDVGVLTSWGRFVLHVHDAKHPRPDRVEIPERAAEWLAKRAEATP